jgi:recombination protein RecR
MQNRQLPKSLQAAIDQLSRLPGIGPKSASRLVFYLLTRPEEMARQIGTTLVNLRENLVTCQICWNIAEQTPCQICEDATRIQTTLLVVEEPLDVLALERAGWTGRYHVLGGVISPINGIGPDQLRVQELFDRLGSSDAKFTEVVLGMDPSLEGEATSLYLQQQIGKLGDSNPKFRQLSVTRLARGLPVGGDLEYADELTLARALEGRKEY